MDSSAEQSHPPSGSKPEEPETSPMAAVPADTEVVWPEDPFEADGHAADAEPDTAAPADPPWTQQGFGKPVAKPAPHPPVAPPAVAPPADDPHTAPFPTISSWSEKAISEPSVGKTQPPPARAMGDAMKTQPPTPRAPHETDEAGDAVKTAPPAPAAEAETEGTKPPVPRSEEALKTAPPIPKTSPALATVQPEADEADAAFKTRPPVPATPTLEPAAAEADADVSEPVPFEAEPRAQDPDSEPDLPVIVPPAVEPAIAAAQPPAVPAPEPAPAVEPPAAPPIAASAEDASNPEIPSWAPKLQPAAEADPGQVRWPGSNLPAWAPVGRGAVAPTPPERVRITSSPAPGTTPAAPAPAPVPAPPPAPAAQAAAPAAKPPPAPPAAASAKSSSSSWEIVQQKVEAAPAFTGPSPEDKSYAEWFAWAKRSGAPASACHAAAQGAFRALSTGQDMSVAVQWATLAMASPPGLVGASRQLYCAWFSLGNIDLKLPTPQAHAFATGAIQALEGGADSMVAHQMGLAAAGITAR